MDQIMSFVNNTILCWHNNCDVNITHKLYPNDKLSHAHANMSFVNINQIKLFAYINQNMSFVIPMTCWDHMSFVHMNQIEKLIVTSEQIAK